jgi:hypothetical protein
MTARPNVELHIDELVLHGFAAADRARIGAAVEQELTRLIARQGLPAGLGSGATAHLDGGSFTVAPTASPDGIGAQVALSVLGGIGR